MWNEVTILWNELTILWNDLTTDWNDLTWNDLTMERNDRIPKGLLSEWGPTFVMFEKNLFHLFYMLIRFIT